MLYVPLGFANANMFDNSEVIGSSSWGSGTVSGSDGSRQVSDKEKEIALTQAKNFANVVISMQKGKVTLQQREPSSTESSTQQSSPVVQKEKQVQEQPKTDAPAAPAKEEHSSIKSAGSSTPDQTKANKVDKKEKSPSKCFCM
jgi:NAD(P)H dehydrogenase (quinone)